MTLPLPYKTSNITSGDCVKLFKTVSILTFLIFSSTQILAKNTKFATASSQEEVEVGEQYYITGEKVNIRDHENKVLGQLKKFDQVEVIDNYGYKDGYVQITFDNSKDTIKKSERYYIYYTFLTKFIPNSILNKGKYFVIQNIATEMLRVYEKQCDQNGFCEHKMVMETEMAVGENKPKTRTIVGSFKITKWYKFYQDRAAHYPSWYRESYPQVPIPGSSFTTWFDEDYMPKSGGNMRGAFGWYTAHVGPNARAQWTHGTLGWGRDKDKYIQATKKYIANILADPRSSGCSRLTNEAVTYLRHLLPVGTPIVKIYAKEALKDPSRMNYSSSFQEWPYILTKENAYSKHNFSSDKEQVLSRGVPTSEFIEQGTYLVDAFPTMVNYKDGDDISSLSAKVNKTGNVYRVHENKMKGVFYIDVGLVKNYSHPKDSAIKVGGYKTSKDVPSWMRATSKNDFSSAAYKNPDRKSDRQKPYDTDSIVQIDLRGNALEMKSRATSARPQKIPPGTRRYKATIKNVFLKNDDELLFPSSPTISVRIKKDTYVNLILEEIDEEYYLSVKMDSLFNPEKSSRGFIRRFFGRNEKPRVKVKTGKGFIQIVKTRGKSLVLRFDR